MIVCLGEINKRRKNHEQNYTKSSYRDSIMSIIDIKLSGRLEDMIKEVEKEYNLSAGEIIANSLDHFIKDKKDFLVGHRFELEQVVKQKQLEFAQATKALELHNARISNFDIVANVSHETSEEPAEEPVVEPVKKSTKEQVVAVRPTKMSFCFTDANLQSLEDAQDACYYDTTEPLLCIRFNRKNVKTFYSHHNNKKITKSAIRVKIGKTHEMTVLSARRSAKKNEATVRSGISPNANKSKGRPRLDKKPAENVTAPLETDKNGYILWKEFAGYRYTELDIMGIALEDNKVNVNQAKGKFLNGIYANTARQAFDMWKNDDKTIGQICHKQLMDAGTTNEKPCSVANMLLSRILKNIWHYGTPEEKGYIFFKDKGGK